jgi:mannose-6-phosphate isomerase-like protein (cupin superfamily)
MTAPLTDHSAAAVIKAMGDCPAYRISPDDTNYFAVVFDGRGEGCSFVTLVEIFEPGGATPPNAHAHAHEMFFVLEGQGSASTNGGAPQPIAKGDALLVRPGNIHVVTNTGPGKLYCLTVMTPDEDFGDLVRSGTPVQLDDADLRVLARA